MVTKKTAKNGDAGSEKDAAKVANEAPSGEPELPYLLGTWHGMTQYRCRQCLFDALEEETILEHIAGHFVEEAHAASSGVILVADKNGNPK